MKRIVANKVVVGYLWESSVDIDSRRPNKLGLIEGINAAGVQGC